MEKPYKLGVIVGRFQTFHNGHKDMLDTALALCERVAVFIGSSQESGTNKNPFTYEMRESILRRVYGDAIEIFPLPDIGVGNNSRWGEYVIESVIRALGSAPDLVISGKEERRVDWLSGEAGSKIAEHYIPKTVDVSAARMREMFVEGDFETWKSFTDERLWDSYEEMRKIVLASYGNTASASL